MKNSAPSVHYCISNNYSKMLLATTLTALFLSIFPPKSNCFITLLREKCPNTGFLLVCIFPHSDWIQRDTTYFSVFSPNAGKYGPEKTPYLTTFHAVHLVITKQYLTKAVLPFGSLSKWLCATSKVAR